MSHRTARDIEHDIVRTRSEVAATIDALDLKLSARRLADEAWRVVRDGSLVEQVRRHPVPLALIGAGIGWLLVDTMTGDGRGRMRGSTDTEAWPPTEAHLTSSRDWSDRDVTEFGETMDDGGSAGKAVAAARRAAGTAAEGAREAGSELAERGREMVDRASDASDRARSGARRAGGRLARMVHDNPLAVGGAVAVAGFVIALALPSTRREEELPQETDGQSAARAGDAVRAAAASAAAAARERGTSDRRAGRDRRIGDRRAAAVVPAAPEPPLPRASAISPRTAVPSTPARAPASRRFGDAADRTREDDVEADRPYLERGDADRP